MSPYPFIPMITNVTLFPASWTRQLPVMVIDEDMGLFSRHININTANIPRMAEMKKGGIDLGVGHVRYATEN
jgi:hypothetical protein